MTRDQWITALEWAVIAAIIALDLAFAAGTGIPVVDWQKKAEALAIVIAGWPAIALLSRVTNLAKGGAFLAEIPGKALTYVAVASVLEYYLATSPAPLHDNFLAGIDRALGFDWRSMCSWTAARPQLHQALTFAYFNLASETCLVLVVIGLFYPARARRFVTALIVSSVFTIPFLWIFPVAGPFISFADLPQYCISDAYVGPHHFMMMRTHGFSEIDLGELSGIVEFPSYHATAATLLTYFLRRIPLLFPAGLAFNAVMIAATPLIGGHYLIDVIAGLVVAAATIYVLERLDAGHVGQRAPLWRRPSAAGSL